MIVGLSWKVFLFRAFNLSCFAPFGLENMRMFLMREPQFELSFLRGFMEGNQLGSEML